MTNITYALRICQYIHVAFYRDFMEPEFEISNTPSNNVQLDGDRQLAGERPKSRKLKGQV